MHHFGCIVAIVPSVKNGSPLSIIAAVPTFIVDGRWIIEGAVPVEMLREVARKISTS